MTVESKGSRIVAKQVGKSVKHIFEFRSGNRNANISCVDRDCQGTNAKKVISEVYTFFVLQCTVFGRKSNHKTDVTA